MKKAKKWDFDPMGWIFWLVCFLILIGPSIYFGWKIRYEDGSALTIIVLSIVAAAFAAGFIAWIVNVIADWWRKRKRISDRKRTRKGR